MRLSRVALLCCAAGIWLSPRCPGSAVACPLRQQGYPQEKNAVCCAPPLFANRSSMTDHDRARKITDSLLAHGAIKRRPCVYCGASEVTTNHKSYEKPWDVNFLCWDCHVLWHKANGSRPWVSGCRDCFVCRQKNQLPSRFKLWGKFIKYRILRLKRPEPTVYQSQNYQNPIWDKVADLQKQRCKH